MGRPKKVILKSGKRSFRGQPKDVDKETLPWNRRTLPPAAVNGLGNCNKMYPSTVEHHFREYCPDEGSTYNPYSPTYVARQPHRETENLRSGPTTAYYSPYPHNYPNNKGSYFPESRPAYTVNSAVSPNQDISHLQCSREQLPRACYEYQSRPQVFDLVPQFTISNGKMIPLNKWASKENWTSVPGFESGSNSPREGSGSHDSVTGTHGSDSSYDVEDDLDVILTSIEQAKEMYCPCNSQAESWSSSDDDSSFNPNIYTVEPNRCLAKQPIHNPNYGSLPPRQDSGWRYFCDRGNRTEDSLGQTMILTQPLPHPTEGTQQSPDPNRATPASQGLSSQMYSSLLMAYNCNSYQDNSGDFHPRQGNVMVHANHCGEVYT